MLASFVCRLAPRLSLRRTTTAASGAFVLTLLAAACGSEVEFVDASGGSRTGDGGKANGSAGGDSNAATGGKQSSGGRASGGQGGAGPSGGSAGSPNSPDCAQGFTTSSGKCQAFRHCKPGTSIALEGTSTRDRTCKPCEGGTFTSEEDAVMCSDWTRCGAAYFEAVKGALDHDVVCEPKPWSRQLGVLDGTFANVTAVSVDAERNVYAAGVLDGTLASASLLDGDRPGGTDMFVIKYDARGREKWAVQVGTTGDDAAYDLALDAEGNIYLAGFCEGDLGLQTSSGGEEACVLQLDASGQVVWTDLLGGSKDDSAWSVAIDSNGGVYLAGSTTAQLGEDLPLGEADAFLRKYDKSGKVQWTSQFGSDAFDGAAKVVVDNSDNVFVAGSTLGTLPAHASSGSQDIFVGKWTSSGKKLWLNAATSAPNDTARTLAVDDLGRAYVGGTTSGAWPNETFLGPYYDALLVAFDENGEVRWVDQFGTGGNDRLIGLAIHGSELWGAGETWGYFGETTASAYADGFTMRHDLEGSLEPTLVRFGTAGDDGAISVAVDNEGSVIVGGYTEGPLNGEEAIGEQDGFVWKLGLVQ